MSFFHLSKIYLDGNHMEDSSVITVKSEQFEHARA